MSEAQTAVRRAVPPCAPALMPGNQSLGRAQLDQEEKHLLPIRNTLGTLFYKMGNRESWGGNGTLDTYCLDVCLSQETFNAPDEQHYHRL